MRARARASGAETAAGTTRTAVRPDEPRLLGPRRLSHLAARQRAMRDFSFGLMKPGCRSCSILAGAATQQQRLTSSSRIDVGS
jgi:hypothetical protein